MVILKPKKIKEVDIDALACKVFLKSLEILGGPKKLIEYRNLTWLPSLMSAAFCLILFNDVGKTEDEIAKILGLTKNTVRNILRSNPEMAKKKLEEEIKNKKLRVHMAGAIAKLAYQKIKNESEKSKNILATIIFGLFIILLFKAGWPPSLSP